MRWLILVLLVFAIGCTTTVTEEIDAPEKKATETNNSVEEIIKEESVEEEVQDNGVIERPKELTSKPYLTRTTATYKNHILYLEGVSQNICGINLDGIPYWIEEGDSQEIGDLTIYVRDVIVSHSFGGEGDMCELSLYKD